MNAEEGAGVAVKSSGRTGRAWVCRNHSHGILSTRPKTGARVSGS